MGRRYKKELGARKYRNYSEVTLNRAIRAVRNGNLSIQAASEVYDIPRRTLWNKIHKRHMGKPGGITALTEAEERALVDVLLVTAEYGCPQTSLDLRMCVKRFLDREGRRLPQFRDNLPGKDWCLNFIERHKNLLTQRSCQNIKRARAENTEVDINAYFDNLEKSLDDVPPENVLNYDETNLSDDPGSRKCIFRRGTKYPERVMNVSKSATSVMFSITGDGGTLPAYVVYKAERLYDQWTLGGPSKARYNRSKSGWFDAVCFEDWFQTIALPWAKNKSGKKLLIGDNLSSHFNVNIITTCQRYNIKFVLLPPNSTHLTQPLDVGYYGPLKRCWKKILTNYKLQNPREKTLTKTTFPSLLKKLVDDLKMTDMKNIRSAFRAAGIIPFNRNEVLKRLPNQRAEDNVRQSVNDTLLEYLKETRSPSASTVPKRKKMLRVEPGKSVGTDDFLSHNNSLEDINDADQPSTSGNQANMEEENDSDFSMQDEILNGCNNSEVLENETDLPLSLINKKKPSEGDFVLVAFPAKKTVKHYVGEIIEKDEDGFVVKYLRKKENGFVYPNVEDTSYVKEMDVVTILEKPTSFRGHYYFQRDLSSYFIN